MQPETTAYRSGRFSALVRQAERSPGLRYGVAVAAVVLGVLLRMPLQPLLGDEDSVGVVEERRHSNAGELVGGVLRSEGAQEDFYRGGIIVRQVPGEHAVPEFERYVEVDRRHDLAET